MKMQAYTLTDGYDDPIITIEEDEEADENCRVYFPISIEAES